MGAKEYIIGALAGTLVALVATRGLGPSSNPDSYIGNGSVGVNLRVERNGSAKVNASKHTHYHFSLFDVYRGPSQLEKEVKAPRTKVENESKSSMFDRINPFWYLQRCLENPGF